MSGRVSLRGDDVIGHGRLSQFETGKIVHPVRARFPVGKCLCTEANTYSSKYLIGPHRTNAFSQFAFQFIFAEWLAQNDATS